jgi:hypothetical protein
LGALQESFAQTFTKACGFREAEPWSLVATSEISFSGFSFYQAFSFAPFVSKEKADLR